MTRFYYTDPLAAAWMAKHFGMQYQSGLSCGGYVVPHDHVYYAGDIIDGNERNMHKAIVIDDDESDRDGWLYIHPDSLHLLEPQVGDILNGTHVMDTPTVRYVEDEDSETLAVAVTLIKRGMRIIQRDGIPFHWPESE